MEMLIADNIVDQLLCANMEKKQVRVIAGTYEMDINRPAVEAYMEAKGVPSANSADSDTDGEGLQQYHRFVHIVSCTEYGNGGTSYVTGGGSDDNDERALTRYDALIVTELDLLELTPKHSLSSYTVYLFVNCDVRRIQRCAKPLE